MIIHELSRDDCLRFLAQERLARLACVHENQPYVVPVYLAYDVLPEGVPCLYGFTTVGQKVEWMRANPLVCVEVDGVVANDQWVSVIALGEYEELPATPGRDESEAQAYRVLQAHAVWWEPAATVGTTRGPLDPTKPFAPVYYRVRIGEVTGHRATPDPDSVAMTGAPVKKEGWLRRALGLGPLPR